MLSIIVAIDEQNAIGKAGGLLCHLPADLKHFKDKTNGRMVLMGERTFLSLPKHPLPNRENVVLTDIRDKTFDGAITVHTINDLLVQAERREREGDEVFIIGGGMVYRQLLQYADKLYITRIHHSFDDATVFFPKIDLNKWMLVSSEKHNADDKNPFDYSFQEYIRRDEIGATF